jgi:hypothetical protein
MLMQKMYSKEASMLFYLLQKTLSQNNYLRTVIGTAPEDRPYQTKVADYLWFSSAPQVNMLPRMMNSR